LFTYFFREAGAMQTVLACVGTGASPVQAG
jgi:hypothetical protein